MPAPANSDGRYCVGLISGTSADAIDAALVRISGHPPAVEVKLVAFVAVPFRPDIRDEVLTLASDDADQAIARLCSLNVVLGEAFAEAALEVCRQGNFSADRLHVVGSHGQTIYHQPHPDPDRPLSVRSTLQIGEPSVIAARLGTTVVADFRPADIAAGGHGAPLVPYVDWVLLHHERRSRAIQNIGGIGNVTLLPAGGSLETVIAFDTGPGNMVIDGLVTLLTAGEATYDRDGRLAAFGIIQPDLLATLMADLFLTEPPPKSTGRERYGLPFCRDLLTRTGLEPGLLASALDIAAPIQQRAADLVATATAFTAASIADAYRRWLPPIDEVFVGGGGGRNPTLMRALRDALAPVPVLTSEAAGVDPDAKEAIAFALLAHDALEGRPTNVPRATGARQAIPLGKIVRPPIASRL